MRYGEQLPHKIVLRLLSLQYRTLEMGRQEEGMSVRVRNEGGECRNVRVWGVWVLILDGRLGCCVAGSLCLRLV